MENANDRILYTLKLISPWTSSLVTSLFHTWQFQFNITVDKKSKYNSTKLCCENRGLKIYCQPNTSYLLKFFYSSCLVIWLAILCFICMRTSWDCLRNNRNCGMNGRNGKKSLDRALNCWEDKENWLNKWCPITV